MSDDLAERIAQAIEALDTHYDYALMSGTTMPTPKAAAQMRAEAANIARTFPRDPATVLAAHDEGVSA